MAHLKADRGLFPLGILQHACYEPDFCGRNLATRAAPDKARVLVPARALYQFGVAPCFKRQCFLG